MTRASQVAREIQAGLYDSFFARLYGTKDGVVKKQGERYVETIRAFEKNYGSERDISIYSAPGRTELCGNHTDHNGGIVMAAAVNMDIVAVVSRLPGNTVRMRSKGYESGMGIDLSDTAPVKAETGKSSAMIRGVAAGFRERDGEIGGFDAYTTSNVLKGSGLSSSAAFEVCVGTILNEEYNEGRFTPIELGIIGQYAENEYFGKPSGLMDQIACAVGGIMSIDFKNASAPVVAKMSFDLSEYGYSMVVTDTKGSHSRLVDEYASIRKEMERVAHFFGKGNLRQVKRELFLGRIADLRLEAGDRATLRALHFFEECRRVQELSAAVERGDIKHFLRLILESGHSSFEYNQNAYQAREPDHQGIPLALALSQLVLEGQGAWRLQGGGFAGTIQAFVPDGLLERYCSVMQGVFGEGTCHILSFREEGSLRLKKSDRIL